MTGYVAAISAFCIWGLSSTVLVRHLEVPGAVAACLGFLVASSVMLARLVLLGRAGELRIAFRDHGLRLLGTSAAFAGCSVCYQTAVKATSVANAVLTHYFTPILTVVLFAPLFLKEKVTRTGLLALGVGFAGLVVLLAPQLSFDGPLLGVALGTVSAFFYAWFNVQAPKLKGKMGRDVFLCANLFLSMVLVIPFAALSLAGLSPAERPTFSIGQAGLIVLFGLSNYAITNAMYFYALMHAPVGRVSTLGYLEPVVAIVSAALFLSEPISASAGLGGALIIGSGLLVMFGDRFLERKSPSV